MASDWLEYKLADLCDSIDYGFTTSAKDEPVGPKFLRITDIVSGHIDWDAVPYCESDQATTGKYLLHKNDIVIARTGANTGSSMFIFAPPKAVFASYLVRLQVSEKAHSRFISYFLKSPAFWAYMRGVLGDKSAQPNASAKTMTQVKLRLPPFHEQRAIAHILGSLDDKIELNQRMNWTLEAMARAIFKSWFVDFDPVHAKVEGRDPSLPDEIAALFPDSFEDSELGEIPKGWEVKAIGEAVKCVGGSTPSTKNPAFWDGGKNPFVTPKDMSSLKSPVILDTSRHITDAGVDKISSGRLPIGTVILSSRAPIGYLAITEVPVSVNQGIIAMICDKALPNYHVLYWTEATMDTIKINAGGTTFAEISKRNFRPIQVIVPHERVLEAYVQQIEPLHQQIVLNLQESSTLASLCDTLLPKLISGELRLPAVVLEFAAEAGLPHAEKLVEASI